MQVFVTIPSSPSFLWPDRASSAEEVSGFVAFLRGFLASAVPAASRISVVAIPNTTAMDVTVSHLHEDDVLAMIGPEDVLLCEGRISAHAEQALLSWLCLEPVRAAAEPAKLTG